MKEFLVTLIPRDVNIKNGNFYSCYYIEADDADSAAVLFLKKFKLHELYQFNDLLVCEAKSYFWTMEDRIEMLEKQLK